MNAKKLQLKKKQLKNLSLDSLVLPQNKITKVVGGNPNLTGDTDDPRGTSFIIDRK
jgi:hypothetical protein